MFPRLQSITLWPGNYSLAGILTFVRNLDIYVPTYQSWQEWCSVLAQTPVLESLRITSHPQIPVEMSPSLRLEQLRTLEIGTGSHDSFLQCWLHNTSAPSLQTLSFSLSWRPLDIETATSAQLCNFVSILLLDYMAYADGKRSSLAQRT